MPSYISHAIMGEQIYNQAIQDESIFKIPIPKTELQGYSLGVDLAILSGRTLFDPNNCFTKDLLISIIKYIRENQLRENPHTISLAYGHICHYFLDVNAHPLIYYIDKGTVRTSIIPNHDLIEGYLSSYLSQKVLGKDIMDIQSSYFNQVNINNPEIKRMLNNIYGIIYSDYQIIKSYKKVLFLFATLENFIKNGKITKEQLIKLSGFSTYLQRNNLTLNELTNEEHLPYTNPVTGAIHQESFIELYERSIQMSLEAIKLVNGYIYDANPIETLNSVFTRLSYDTGVECSLGTNMKYVRKRINK